MMTLGFLGILLFQPGPAPALGLDQTFVWVQKKEQATLAVAAPVKDELIILQLSDLLLFRLTVEGPVGLEVRVPHPVTGAQTWTIRQKSSPLLALVAPGRLRWQQDFLAEPLVPGSLSLPLEPLQYRVKGGPWQSVSWQPLLAQVKTSITQPDLKDLRDIAPIEELPPVPSWWKQAVWFLVGLAGMGVLFLGYWLGTVIRRRKRQALTPEQWAGRELERVLAMGLPESGEVERFFTLLSNLLRRYLERRFGIPARRQTSPEFFQALEKSPACSQEQRAFLRDFLKQCDLAKFAAFRFSPDECRAAVARIQNFIRQN